MSTVRDVIKNLFEFNLDAEFEIILNISIEKIRLKPNVADLIRKEFIQQQA